MFSVIIPLYNKELSVTKTIESVLNQTLKDFEIIIVNDGSTDNSYNVVKTIKDKRIKLIDKKNGGVSSARNKGIKEANFKWICFLDADDLWLPDHLQTLFEMVQLYPTNLVFSTGYIRSNTEFPKVNVPQVVEIEDYFLAENKCFFWTSVTCINKIVFDRCGLFLEQFSRGEDLEMWQRIGRYYSFITNKKITAIYRVDAENQLTKSSFLYSKSTISVLSQRYPYFIRKSEKDFIIKRCYEILIIFIKRREFSNFIKLLFQYLKIRTRRIKI